MGRPGGLRLSNGKGWAGAENGRYGNRVMALMFPIVQALARLNPSRNALGRRRRSRHAGGHPRGAVMRALAVGLVAVAAALACGPRRIARSPVDRELLVLLPDPEGGASGRATVTGSSATVNLVGEREATEVVANRPPTPPFTIAEARVRQIFGDALSALPPAPRAFNLYFQFDSDELTEETRALLPEILRLVKERPVPDVVAIGHTDTSGSAASNFQLGLRRATRVRDLLVGAGLDAALIAVMSVGEAEPLIPTPDETKEPRNRRVEVAVR
jgi:peptidoglycan-associated lipoprotein